MIKFDSSPEAVQCGVPVVDVAVLASAVGRHEVGHEWDGHAHVAHPVAGGRVEEVADDLQDALLWWLSIFFVGVPYHPNMYHNHLYDHYTLSYHL